MAGHPDLQRLLAHWREKGGRETLLRRAEVDPVDLRFMLDRIGLVEVHPPAAESTKRRYRLRVIGSWWRDQFDFEPTGRWIEEWPSPEQRQVFTAAYDSVLAQQRPVLYLRNNWFDEKKLTYEILLLPLAADNGEIGMILIGVGPFE